MSPRLPSWTTSKRWIASTASRLLRFVAYSTGDQDLAETIVQDCLLKAYNARESFRGDCAVYTWLAHIATNLIRDHQRTRKFQFWRTVQKTAPDLSEMSSLLPSRRVRPNRRSSPASARSRFRPRSKPCRSINVPSFSCASSKRWNSRRFARPPACRSAPSRPISTARQVVHDLGHPPFGHAGEKALDAAMRAHGLLFDDNLHALRIVEDFEQRYAAFRGLNLTFEVREGIIKHSRDYDEAQHPELVEYVLDQRPPLEAQLIDWTDEIGYNTADLDDGYEAHLLTLEQIRNGVPVFESFFRKVEKTYPKAPDKLKFNEALKEVFNRLTGDLITNTEARLKRAGIKTLADVRLHQERIAAFSPEVEAERKQIKDFLYENLYYSASLAGEKDLAERIVSELFAFWMNKPSALPHYYQEKAGQESLPRVVCDYIAGMTDHFIIDQYEKHCGGRAIT